VAQWFVMQEASRHVKVVLEGDGSDELLGGYGPDAIPYLIDRARRGGMGAGLVQEMIDLARIGGTLRWFLLTAARQHRHDPRRGGEQPYTSTLNNVLWNGLRREGLPETLHGTDALGMAHSVESRAPFLDHRVVEFCFSLAFHEKIAKGWTKSLLRRSMVDLLPPEILSRRTKFGNRAPVASWLGLKPNMDAVRDLLLDPRSTNRGHLERRRLELELQTFQGAPSRFTRLREPELWRWITLELWFRQFIDGEGFE
jgi:asparagine synthase (glutamine-hydrolysing)